MNIPCKTGLILSLAVVFSLPINALAAEAAPPAATAEQPAVQPMSPMHDLMRDMRRDQDPSKCKTMKGMATEQDTPCPMPGMGMGMGPGKGGMYGENCKMGGGMQGQHMNCHMREGMDDKRMDMLEKRMEMLQMMLEMMMRQPAGRY